MKGKNCMAFSKPVRDDIFAPPFRAVGAYDGVGMGTLYGRPE
jgi:hypothetical protein